MKPGARPTIVVSVNTAWNLVNFRTPVLEALIAAGYEVVAATPPDPVAEAQLVAMGCRFIPLPFASRTAAPLANLLLIWRLRAILRREHPRAYLSWTIKNNIYGAIAARSLGIPAIANVSGLGTAFLTPGVIQQVVRRLYRHGLASCARVFFQNAADRALFVEQRLVRADRAALLPGSGIDLARFVPAPLPDRPIDAPRFLLVARMLRDKGVEEFVAAARIVRGRHPAATFVLLGQRDVDNRTAIASDRIDGWVAEGLIDYHQPVADVRPAMRDADCIVLPSYREGTSRVLLEGAALGRPLIATDVPGCRELVEHGGNGLLCAARDPGSLAEAMLAFVALDRGARERMAAAGRRLVEERYDQAIVARRYLAEVAALPGGLDPLGPAH